MFSRLRTYETFVAETFFASEKEKNVSDFFQKYFVSVINVFPRLRTEETMLTTFVHFRVVWAAFLKLSLRKRLFSVQCFLFLQQGNIASRSFAHPRNILGNNVSSFAGAITHLGS